MGHLLCAGPEAYIEDPDEVTGWSSGGRPGSRQGDTRDMHWPWSPETQALVLAWPQTCHLWLRLCVGRGDGPRCPLSPDLP